MKCLVTAIGSMSAEAVIGALKRQGQGQTTIVGCNIHPRDWVAAARLVDGFHQVPPARDAAAYTSRLMEICVSEGITHVIALTDPEVDVLSEQRDQFESLGVTLCLPDQSAVRLARDKLALHGNFHGHPRVQPIPTLSLQHPLATRFRFPLLAKPRYGRSSEGQHAVPDTDALRYWQSRLEAQDYIVQPFLNGEVFVTDLVMQPELGRSVALTRHELLRTANGAGMAVEVQPNHVCNELAREVAQHIGLRGCSNIEFLVVEGKPYLMDVNPRFSAGVIFSMLAGYDMANNHLNCFTSTPIDAGSPVTRATYTRGYHEYPAGAAHATT